MLQGRVLTRPTEESLQLHLSMRIVMLFVSLPDGADTSHVKTRIAYTDKNKIRVCNPCNPWLSISLILEGELQLIANHAAATIGKLRMEELTTCGSEDVSRHTGTAR